MPTTEVVSKAADFIHPKSRLELLANCLNASKFLYNNKQKSQITTFAYEMRLTAANRYEYNR